MLRAGSLIRSVALMVGSQPAAADALSHGDASNRRIAQEIRKHHASNPKSPVRVSAVTWHLEEGLNFYRRMYRLDWMQPVDRSPADSSFDYYVALPDDAAKLDQLPVTKIYEDAVTHAIVAVKR